MAVFGGSNQIEQYAFVQYQNALSSPLTNRCQVLTALLQSLSLKELKYFFGRLVEDIFGYRTKQDWGLITLNPKEHDREYAAFKSFLAVDGPILQLSYKLLDDPQAQFEFHVSCLPAPSRQALEKRSIPPLYSNKVYAVPGGGISSCLQLNSFEFYLFHFAYFIVNPTWKGCSSPVNQVDTLYAYLLEEYLRFFLPIDGSPAPVLSPTPVSPLIKTFLHSPRSPGLQLSRRAHVSNLNNSSPATGQSFYHRQQMNLLKPGALEMIDSIPDYSTKGVAPLGASKSETWRSEEFISILSEMYLNQYCQKQVQNIAGILKERYVPSHYHVYMVRVLVKHVHYFANSFIGPTGPFISDVLGELKSVVLPRLVQKNLHSFLKLTFDRWPLDDSFRVPLETWLSYIQPWRYTDARAYKDAEERGFVNRWQKFVVENLHFYTPLFSQVMHRFSRMDLSCPKTAYMLFRATKVFSQEDFDTMILEAEKHYMATQSRSSPNLRSSIANMSGYSTSYLNETSMVGFQDSQSSVSSSYLPLYNKILINQISRLIMEIMSTRDKALSMKLVNGNGYKGFFSSLFTLSDDSSSVSAEEYSPTDSKKLVFHLETSMNNLCKLFKLTMPTHSSPSVHHNLEMAESSLMNSFDGFEPKKQSPLKKLQAFNCRKTDKIDYHGNPDLQPVRTFEYEILVKMFSDISEYLNNKYSHKIQELYFRPSIFGHMCQQVLARPTDYCKIIKSKDMQSVTKKNVHLPPRIYLRILANKHIVWYFVIYFLFMFYMDYHPLSAILLLVSIISLIIFIRALFIQDRQLPREH